MNRRTLLLAAATSLLVAPADAAPPPGQVKGMLTVNVLSLDRENFMRHEYLRESFKTGERSSGWDELTTLVAKARVETVLSGDLGLNPGAVIEIRYLVSRRSEPASTRPPATLTPGETVTISVFRGQTSFWWSGSGGVDQ
jgi:hypothetical protein